MDRVLNYGEEQAIHRCETCPHWKGLSPHAEDTKELLSKGWGQCEQAISEDNKPLIADTLAFAEDGEAYRAALLTHRTFGCVMHPENGTPPFDKPKE